MIQSIEEFVNDLDLPKNNNKKMSTYTVMTNENKRLQFSGPLFLPWKFLFLKRI